MQTWQLAAHPDHPPLAVTGLSASMVGASEHWLRLRWRIDGAGVLELPPLAGKGRTDGLWEKTCFELFVAHGHGYAEYNFSPSERWAAYDFTGYRAGMTQRAMPRDPVCTMRRGSGGSSLAIFDAEVPLAGLPPLPWRMGLSAVIVEEGGHKSFWALAHAPGRPDFHHDTCFAVTLGAPEAA
ncbi:MAG: hypothetical protein RIQ46_394 [Pseudomonadota bacterium]|jgi:hypothetical protein